MGFAIAEAARDREARVTIVAGPISLETPAGCARRDVSTVAQMLDALMDVTSDSDALIMSAAPADFRPENPATQKMKKTPGQDAMTIHLAKNPDILASLPAGGVRVGFAAETENLAENAVAKLASKRLQFIVGNDVTAPGSGFGVDTNQVTIFHATGEIESLPLMTKYEGGHAILDRVVPLLP